MPIELNEHDWGSHRATIEFLYLTEKRKLEGAGGVMEQMLCKYSFKATYELPWNYPLPTIANSSPKKSPVRATLQTLGFLKVQEEGYTGSYRILRR
jgi:hypothetical protein